MKLSISILCLLLFSSCATKLTSIGSFSEIDSKLSYLLITLDNEGSDLAQCRYRLKDLKSKSEYLISTNPNQKDQIFAQIPYGEYQLQSIECYQKDITIQRSNYQYIYKVIGPGIAYGGGIFVTSEQDKKHYSFHYDITRQLQLLKKISTQYNFIKNPFNLYSAFNQKKITHNIIATQASGAPTTYVSGDARYINKYQILDTSSCYQEEMNTNYLMIGDFHIEAKFKNGSFVSHKMIKDANTYSQKYKECIIRSIEEHKPNIQSQINMNIKNK